ncbi:MULTISPECIES: FadR/GntR family transcriptional regulator [unclassified Amycolatopsis]|uniref:FadR/GntR family transcriptional regulator n=1 Tax=unclassified Amycolatopsis TaxID=2618356 RepID=UPI002874E231|nr:MULTISPECIES: FCD domain-containing protein [unclassified Amycolatopsis]MDS0139349.1 FadR family transcriptional regulator [Amycolatopsis sp. 505]MDS0144581.1 FadR family transcriptional regulator [Amycolatopsis sp. CM201R]
MNLHARIVDELGRLIVEGVLGDGQPLVPEELGRRFSASRTVVREALRVLESKGMVTARPRVGTWTLPPEAWDAIDPDVIAWRVGGPGGREHLRELLELRLAIEPQAARMAARHRRPDELSAMAAAYAQMADAVERGEGEAFQDADSRFHAALIRASGNTLIAQLQVPVAAALRAQGEPMELVAHSRVLTLVLAKNADGAESACRRLLETVAAYR